MKAWWGCGHNILTSWLAYLLLGLGLFAIASFALSAHFRFQGLIFLQESLSEQCVIPHTFAISFVNVKSSNKAQFFLPLEMHSKISSSVCKQQGLGIGQGNLLARISKSVYGNGARAGRKIWSKVDVVKNKLFGLPVFKVHAEILKIIPHARQKFKCVSENRVLLGIRSSTYGSNSDFSQIAFDQSDVSSCEISNQQKNHKTRELHLEQCKNFSPLQLNLNSFRWKVAALSVLNISEAIVILSNYSENPIIAFIEDENKREYVCLKRLDQDIQVSSLASLLKNPLVSLGKNAYGIELKVPDNVYLKVQSSVEVLQPSGHLENDTPALYALFSENEKSEGLTLVYDPFASGVQWPLFEGKYAVRFQPLTKQLPFKVRWIREQISSDLNFNIVIEQEAGISQHIRLSPNEPLKIQGGYELMICDEGLRSKIPYLIVTHRPCIPLPIYVSIFLATSGICFLFFLAAKRMYSK